MRIRWVFPRRATLKHPLKTSAGAYLRRVATQLEQHGQRETKLSAEVGCCCVFPTPKYCVRSSVWFHVLINVEDDDLLALASNEEDWATAWERGMEPIKRDALQPMKIVVWNMQATRPEDSYTFQTAMVLLASETGRTVMLTASRSFWDIHVARCR